MRTFIFKNSRNDAVTLAVNAFDEKTAVSVMSDVVGNCASWELQYDFEMEDLEEDFSEDALDHVDEDVDLDDYDEDDYTDLSDTRNPFRDEDYGDGRGYN
jgi:hypothetical protein